MGLFYSIVNAAKECNVSRRTIWRKIKELDIEPMVIKNVTRRVGSPMKAYLTQIQLDRLKVSTKRVR